MLTFFVFLTAIAFRFFELIIALVFALLLWLRLFNMLERGTRFFLAWLIAATQVFGLVNWQIFFVVARVFFFYKKLAFFRLTLLFLIFSYTGDFAFFLIIMTLYLANFICAAKKLLIWALTTKFFLVKVESEVIFTRELQGALDLVNGLVAKTNLFALLKGFVLGGTLLYIIL